MRENAGYQIINSLELYQDHELVIGHNPEAAEPYVCWYCRRKDGKEGYYAGSYFLSYTAAMMNLALRIMQNREYIPHDLTSMVN